MINGLGKYIVKQKRSPEQARGPSPGLTARSVRLLLSGRPGGVSRLDGPAYSSTLPDGVPSVTTVTAFEANHSLFQSFRPLPGSLPKEDYRPD